MKKNGFLEPISSNTQLCRDGHYARARSLIFRDSPVTLPEAQAAGLLVSTSGRLYDVPRCRVAFRMQVPPGVAQEWLDERGPNRVPRKSAIGAYAHDIERGDWVDNGETIIFDTEGRVIDGQTRLLAVLAADKPIVSLLAFGYPSHVSGHIDRGAMRNYLDQTRIMATLRDVPVPSSTAGQTLCAVVNSYRAQKRKVSYQEIMVFWPRHREAVVQVCAMFADRPLRGVNVACVRAPVLRAILSGEDKDRVERFVRLLTEQDTTTLKKDKVVVLTRYVLAALRSHPGSPTHRAAAYRVVESGLRAFLAGRAPAKLSGAPEELFPVHEDRELSLLWR